MAFTPAAASGSNSTKGIDIILSISSSVLSATSSNFAKDHSAGQNLAAEERSREAAHPLSSQLLLMTALLLVNFSVQQAAAVREHNKLSCSLSSPPPIEYKRIP
jgi:hypothetical protein